MPPTIHWNIPVNMHWESDNPLDNATETWNSVGKCNWTSIGKGHWKSTMISEVSISGVQSFAPDIISWTPTLTRHPASWECTEGSDYNFTNYTLKQPWMNRKPFKIYAFSFKNLSQWTFSKIPKWRMAEARTRARAAWAEFWNDRHDPKSDNSQETIAWKPPNYKNTFRNSCLCSRLILECAKGRFAPNPVCAKPWPKTAAWSSPSIGPFLSRKVEQEMMHIYIYTHYNIYIYIERERDTICINVLSDRYIIIIIIII